MGYIPYHMVKLTRCAGPSLQVGHVMHRRLRPSVHAFVYPVFFVRLPLGQLGNFLGVGSLVSLAIVLSALPGFLYLADPLIIKKKKQPKEA